MELRSPFEKIDQLKLEHALPTHEPTLSTAARALVDADGDVIFDAEKIAGGSATAKSAFRELIGAGQEVSTPKVVYIETDGDNDTAEIGNPTRPYSTAQAAYDAALAAAGNHVIQLGIGNFAGIVSAVEWPSRIQLRGRGRMMTVLAAINCNGTNGAHGTPNGGNGGNASNITLQAGELTISNVSARGGHGGNVTTEPGEGNTALGGNGGNGATIIIRGTGGLEISQIDYGGGQGGFHGWFNYGAGAGTPDGSNGGNGGSVTLYDLICGGISGQGGPGDYVSQAVGSGGNAGGFACYNCRIVQINFGQGMDGSETDSGNGATGKLYFCHITNSVIGEDYVGADAKSNLELYHTHLAGWMAVNNLLAYNSALTEAYHVAGVYTNEGGNAGHIES